MKQKQTIHDARVAILHTLHDLRGSGTAEVIRMRAKLAPALLSEAMQSLVADKWIEYRMAGGFGVWCLTPNRRKQAAFMEHDHAQ